MGLRVGLDQSLLTAGLSYTRGIRVRRIRRSLMIGGELSMPLLRPDLRDSAIAVRARMSAVAVAGFELPLALGLRVINTDNDLFRGTALGSELATYPGYYRSRWAVAAEVNYRQTWATHLTHADIYTDRIHPAPSGWYATPAYAMRYGLRVGGLPHPRFEMLLRVGYLQLASYNQLLPPVYADLSVSVRF